MKLHLTLIAALSALSLAGPATASAAAAPGFPVAGLTPDTWGTTTVGARKHLLATYAGIGEVSCLGVRMIGRPASKSSWVANGVRYWDKNWCQGTLRSGSVFRLVHDAKSKTNRMIYRLVGATVADLRSGGTKPQPAPAPAPAPKPSNVGDQLLQAANALAVDRGRNPESTPTHRGLRYSVQDCMLVSPATARCTLYVLYEDNVMDSQFRPGHLRYWVRLYTFARLLSLDPVAWDTRIEGGYFDRPYQIVCSDRNDLGYIVVDYDPLTGNAAPPCP